MHLLKIKNISYENTLKAFQTFYDEPLNKDDALKIQKNLIGVLYILSRSKSKISQIKDLC